MEYGEEEGNFDTVIVNDDLDTAYENLKAFLLESFQNLGKWKNNVPMPLKKIILKIATLLLT